MGFFKQEYWHRLPFPSPGDFPNPGLKLTSPVSPALELDSLPDEPSWKPIFHFAKSLQLCLTLCDFMHCSLPSSMRFSRQEYWRGLSFPPPGVLPDTGIKPESPESPTLAAAAAKLLQ